MHVSPSLHKETNEIPWHSLIEEAVYKKLIFPEKIDHNPADSQENAPVEETVMYHTLTMVMLETLAIWMGIFLL